ILTYHVVAGKVTSAEVASGAATTVEGSNIELTVGNGIQVNGANVVLADVEASNGVIHVIDQVLIPPTVDVSKL
ncbi:MAG: fasciclin domain-containing protein, partial [Ilumatobacteraceae bacterium]